MNEDVDMRRHAVGRWSVHQTTRPDDGLDELKDERGEIDCAACGETWLRGWGETEVVAVRVDDDVICADCVLGLLE